MMKTVTIFILALCAACLHCADFSVLMRNGQKLPEKQKNVRVEMRTVKNTDSVETIEYRLTSLIEKPQYYRIRCSVQMAGDKITLFDGLDRLFPQTGKSQKQMLMLGVFPLAAIWTGNTGVALAAGAEDHHSFLDLRIDRGEKKTVITEEVSAALLKKGSVYQGKFHIIRFSPKYNEKDAFARYYKLYPKRFLRNPDVDPRLYGISASYACWFRSDPEWSRFGGAEWEWCVHAGRHWGDISGEYFDLPHEKYVPICYFSHRSGRWDPQKLDGISKEKFRKIQQQRLSDGYYCGVANAFYTTGASRIHNQLAAKFKDSLSDVNPCILDHGYDYAANIFAFPETSWGKEIMRMFKLAAARDEISAFAFDIPLESEVYRGEKLQEMSNVGFDKFGPGIVRGVANSKLYEQINRIPAKYGSRKLGTVVNTNGIHHINNCFYADTIMLESNPWQYASPWPRSARYAMGEKGVTFWEGYRLSEFNPNHAKEWTAEERNRLLQDLSRYVAHRAFLFGVTYPASFTTEYLSRLAPAMQACSQAGYKVVPGMKTLQKEITLSRYGSAEKSLIAVCNLSRKEQNVKIEIFPEEFRSDTAGGNDKTPLLFAGFFGGTVNNIYNKKQTSVNCPVAPLGINVLEAAGSAAIGSQGNIRTAWQSGFMTSKLILRSESFRGKIKLRKQFGNYILEGEPEIQLDPGSKKILTYRNRSAQISDAEIMDMPLLNKNKQPRFVVYYAADQESRDMAERVLAFFKGLGKFKNPSFKLDLELSQKTTLPCYTIVLSLDRKIPEKINKSVIGGNKHHLTVSSENRDDFSRLTRSMLDMLNALKYPEYIYGAPMSDFDRSLFKSRRF